MAGVEALLGLSEGLGSPGLVEAAALWPGWVDRELALGAVGGPKELDGWVCARRAAGDWAAVDELVGALGRLGAAGEEPAPLVLAWMLRRPAQKLVGSLRHLGRPDEIEHLVAANLWVTCRTMPDRWSQRVAANVIQTVRARVVLDAQNCSRRDGTATLTELASPTFWDRLPDARSSAMSGREAGEVLAWAVEAAILSPAEMDLLLKLVAALHLLGTPRTGRWAGVTSRAASAGAAAVLGMSEATVRRQAAHALRALQSACAGPERVA